MFLEISQNSQENTCTRASFSINLQAWACNFILLKKRLWDRCFPVNFATFLRTPILRNTSRRLLHESHSDFYFDNHKRMLHSIVVSFPVGKCMFKVKLLKHQAIFVNLFKVSNKDIRLTPVNFVLVLSPVFALGMVFKFYF